MRTPQLVFGLQGLGRSMAGAIGAAGALLAVAPLLVPVALVALIPGWLASSRRGRAVYAVGVTMTPRGPGRSYLAGLLARPPPAEAGPARNRVRRVPGRTMMVRSAQ